MANWYCSSVKYAAVTAWAASTAKTVGQIVRQLATPAQGSERCFRCTVAGTTGATEPSWTLTAGGTTTSGTATFVECTGLAAYNGDGGGSAWAAPAARVSILTASGWMNQSGGDTLYVGHDHAETNSGAVNFYVPGVGSRMICVNTAGSVPPVSADLRTSASLTSSGTTDSICGQGYIYGVNHYNGSSNFLGGIIFQGTTYAENCSFNLTNAAASYVFVGNGNGGSNNTEFKNVTVSFANTLQGILNQNGTFKWSGSSSSITGAVIPSTLIGTSGSNIIIDGVDLSAINTSLFGTAGQNGPMMIVNCKLNSSVTFASWSATAQNPSLCHLDVIGCDYASTPVSAYKNARLSCAGTLTTDTVKARSSGASDGKQTYSWSITTSSLASALVPFETFEIPVWVDTTGAHTATIEMITDNVVLTNNDVVCEARYFAAATSPIVTIANGSADPLRVASNLTVSSATWSGSFGTPKPQSISLSFTTALPGYVRLKVLIRKPSLTLNVCPKVTLT